VHEVVADALEADGARVVGDAPHLRDALHAVDDVLDLRIEVLHAEAQAAKAEPVERVDVVVARDAGIDLAGELGVGGEARFFEQARDEPLELVGRQERRRAATQVQLGDGHVGAPEAPQDEVPLGQHAADIRCGDLVLSRDARVAAAVGAEALAERHVYIDAGAELLRLGASERGRHVTEPLALGGGSSPNKVQWG
jgi:hypothetical protein